MEPARAAQPRDDRFALLGSLAQQGVYVGVKDAAGRRKRHCVGGEGHVQRSVRPPERKEGVVSCVRAKQAQCRGGEKTNLAIRL